MAVYFGNGNLVLVIWLVGGNEMKEGEKRRSDVEEMRGREKMNLKNFML